jgi:hypothetical protein
MADPHIFTLDLIDAIEDAYTNGDGRLGEKTLERELDKRGFTVCAWLKVGEDGLPEDGQLMVCTDGVARWLDQWRDGQQYGDPWMGGLNRKRATHWFPVQEIPTP